MSQTIHAAGRIILCFLALLSACGAQYDPQEWPQVTLRFSEGTLKDVFDAGLRPYRFPSLERSLLEAKHVRVTVTQRNGERLLEFPAERITINPLQGGLLSSLEMTRRKITLGEARALMLPYLSKGGRDAQELESFLAAVEADHLDYDGMGRGTENFTVRWSDDGGPRYAVAFRKAFDPVQPLIFFMVIDWSQVRTPRQKRSFYKEPIPPPPGYEHVSMQAPEKFGPDSQADILVSQGKQISGDRVPATPQELPLAATAPTPVLNTVPPPATVVARIPSEPLGQHPRVWLWGLGVLGLFLIVAAVLKRRS